MNSGGLLDRRDVMMEEKCYKLEQMMRQDPEY